MTHFVFQQPGPKGPPAVPGPVLYQRQKPAQQAPATKTKCALAFLCLFDGLRTPSIRRLVRKPRTVCKKPLLTFDPAFYAPSTKNSLQEIYASSLNCPCEMAVDPAVGTVLALLRKHTTSMPPQRVILHYFGHGCHPPLGDGCLYFFSDDRARYRPLKIQNIIKECKCPLCLILDCPFAAVLKPLLSSRSDLFAFFACSDFELLPLSTDVPMDMFSSCLLRPFESALSWHLRQHSSVYREQKVPDEEHREFLQNFFSALLDAIIFDTQSPQDVEAFTKDPSIASLMRGFVLAQRVMLSFNLHPESLPEVKPMASHPLWEMWDIVLDFSITLSKEQGPKMVFDLFMASFDRFPKAGYFPLFSFLLKVPEFSQRTAEVLLDYLDKTEGAIETAARTTIARTIIEMQKPSATAMLILAKIIATGLATIFDRQTPINFPSVNDPAVLSNGMLALCCAMASQAVPSLNSRTQLCIDHAIDCAPYSALLLGLIIERGGTIMKVQTFSQRFLPLLASPREDVRASAVFLLGLSRDRQVIEPVVKLLNDPSAFVRMQVLYSLVQLMRVVPDKQTFRELEKLQKDRNKEVRTLYDELKDTIVSIEANGGDSFGQKQVNSQTQLLSVLTNSVRSVGFVKRMETNIFEQKTV